MKQDYKTRAMQSKDPRYARILGTIEYGTKADPLRDEGPSEALKALRDEYQGLYGKKPYHGWDEATLAAKIAEYVPPDAGAEDQE